MRIPVLVAAALAALILAACGTEGTDVPAGDSSAAAGAEIFAANCAGCHTMTPAGANGSGEQGGIRVQGPNFDQRFLGYDETLFAIRNGGYSGAIMPQNIVVGEEASLVSEFVAKYSGTEAEDSPRPSPEPGTESEGASEDTVEADGIGEDSAGDSAVPAEGQGQSGGAGSSPGSTGGQSGPNGSGSGSGGGASPTAGGSGN